MHVRMCVCECMCEYNMHTYSRVPSEHHTNGERTITEPGAGITCGKIICQKHILTNAPPPHHRSVRIRTHTRAYTHTRTHLDARRSTKAVRRGGAPATARVCIHAGRVWQIPIIKLNMAVRFAAGALAYFH